MNTSIDWKTALAGIVSGGALMGASFLSTGWTEQRDAIKQAAQTMALTQQAQEQMLSRIERGETERAQIANRLTQHGERLAVAEARISNLERKETK